MSLSIVSLENKTSHQVLLEPAQEITFPLTAEINTLIDQMLEKLNELQGAGLAAPQVGYPYKIIVYQVLEMAKKFRADWYAALPPTVLINPSFEPIVEAGFTDDWEGCFSVETQMGKIRRYTSIRFQGFDRDGNKIEGQADGYRARILQHEINHLNGCLIPKHFRDDLPFGSIEEMKKLRQEEIESVGKNLSST